MSLLLSVLRAAHANSTHHKLVLDALGHVDGPDAEAWRRLLLSEHAQLLAGAKAPDDEFKDFANHVLHPRDGYWGGAPEKVVEWYGTLVAALAASDWPRAAYAAGVLSHYVSDPLMPLHTAQSETEGNFHRAIEWSVSRSYDDLISGAARPTVPVIAAGPSGLKEIVCLSADRASAHYEALMAHYDLAAGVVEPTSGLDPLARAIVGDLLLTASATIGAVLSRAIAEASVVAPTVSLARTTALAILSVPRKLLDKRLVNAREREAVAAMYDELRATGRVEQTLGEDERIVREAYAREVLVKRSSEQDEARRRRVEIAGAVPVSATPAVAGAAKLPLPEFKAPEQSSADAAAVGTLPPPLPATQSGSLRERLEQKAGGDPLARLTPRPAPPRPTTQQPPLLPLGKHLPAAAPQPETVAVAPAVPAPVAAEAMTVAALPNDATATPRIYLAAGDDLEKAPSIGPKTAERLAVAGLRTVADLIAADPDVVAAQAGMARVDGDTVRGWQDEARLVMSVPGLRGGGAQLLVGAGYRTLAAIADVEPDKLCADLLTFATTPAGHRILRDGQPPDIEKVKAWAEAARAIAKAA